MFSLAAVGGDKPDAVDVLAANMRTAHASSVHYRVAITMTQADTPMTLHIQGGAAADRLSVHLSLGLQSASIMRDRPFLYESAPQGIVILGNISWLRLQIAHRSPRSQVLSSLRSLTPAPLLHVVAEAKLRPVGKGNVFSGPVAYDDPVVRTSLHDLSGGFEFRNLRVHVVVGKDGLIHRFLLTGRTADGTRTLALRADLFGFGKPVKVRPPRPGTFMDPQLPNLQS